MGQLAGRFTPAVYACDVEINREVVIYARETAQSPGGLPLGSRTGRGGGGNKAGDCCVSYTPFSIYAFKMTHTYYLDENKSYFKKAISMPLFDLSS